MSSMLKKPGAGAFKPKAPIARRRPAANLATQPAGPTQGTQEQPKTTSAPEPSPSPPQTVTTSSSTAESSSEKPHPPATVVDANNAIKDVSSIRGSEETSNTPQARRVEPVTETPVVTQPEKSTSASSISDNSARPAEDLPESSQNIDQPVTVSLVLETTADPDKNPSTTRAKTSRPTTVTKPRPIAETEPPEPLSTRPTGILPTPPEDPTLTTVVENGEGSLAETTPATVRARKPATQSRKRKSAAAIGESETETGIETDGPPKKKRAPRKKKITAEGAEHTENLGPKKKPQRKRKTPTHSEANSEQAGEGDEEDDGSDIEGSQQGTVARQRRRRRRSLTPENAEQLTIDPATWTMAQLTKDPRRGKRWDKYKDVETAERERKRELQKQRMIKMGLLQEGEELPAGDSSESGTPAPELTPPTREPTPPPAPAGGGMVMRVDANGNIIIDESSLQHDRHKEADRVRGHLQVKEETEFSKRMTQQTYMRRQPQANFWTSEDTEKFYHGLRMFGTDFNMISKMFGGGKSRRQVKLKFNREERAHPVAVNKCLIGEKVVAMDLEEIDGADGLEDSKSINEELARLREEREAEARRLEEEVANEARRKREELFGKKKGGGDKNHNQHEAEADKNDDGLEVVEEIDERALARERIRERQQQQQQQQQHPGAKYGVGTDPDVIDETDLPTSFGGGSSSSRGRGARGGRGGRRGNKAVFASGFGI